MPNVLAISASPSRTSKTAAFADHVLSHIAEPGITVDHLRLRDVDGQAILSADMSNLTLADAAQRVAAADGIIIATPIFKASYSGLLKAFLDVLPQFGLAGKTVLPLATGGSVAHVLALDYALRPVLQSMGARHIVQGFFLPESSVVLTDGVFSLAAESRGPLDEAVHHFICALSAPVGDVLLGHPRPERPKSMTNARLRRDAPQLAAS